MRRGLRWHLRSVWLYHAYFREAEYPMGPVQSWVEAFKFGLKR